MRARSEVGLSRLPVTEEIAGSNPVGPAKRLIKLLGIRVVFIILLLDNLVIEQQSGLNSCSVLYILLSCPAFVTV